MFIIYTSLMVGTERTDFIDRYKTTTMIFSNLDRFLGYFYISDLHSDIRVFVIILRKIVIITLLDLFFPRFMQY